MILALTSCSTRSSIEESLLDFLCWALLRTQTHWPKLQCTLNASTNSQLLADGVTNGLGELFGIFLVVKVQSYA